MRTDSTRISDDALTAVRQHITETYGAEYLPEQANTYANKERAQDAHEAIRPTLMEWTPDKVAEALKDHPEGPELIKLYTLIWQRFVASQMVPAIYDQTTVDMDRGQAPIFFSPTAIAQDHRVSLDVGQDGFFAAADDLDRASGGVRQQRGMDLDMGLVFTAESPADLWCDHPDPVFRE